MCPNCRAFITTNDRTCPYCNQPIGPRAIDVRQPGEILGGLIPHAHFTTILILLINFGLFLVQTLGGNFAFAEVGAKYGPAILQGHEYWRLVTAGFLHGGWMHILMNSWVLYDLGAQVEQVFGTPRFLSIYFVGSVLGFMFSTYMNPQALSVGSSAGIMGLIGAMIAFGVANRSSIGRQIRNFYMRYVVYILVFGLIPVFRVDNWAHIGGLAGGFAVAWVSGTPIRSTAARESIWRVVAALCVLVTIWSFFDAYRHLTPPDQLR